MKKIFQRSLMVFGLLSLASSFSMAQPSPATAAPKATGEQSSPPCECVNRRSPAKGTVLGGGASAGDAAKGASKASSGR